MKETKTTLVKRIMDQIDAIHKERCADIAMGGLVKSEARWYGVAYIGWGSWDEDVFFVESVTPEGAIEQFEDAVKKREFEGHGALNVDDRCLFGQDERILVYEISEYAEYRRTKWEKI